MSVSVSPNYTIRVKQFHCSYSKRLRLSMLEIILHTHTRFSKKYEFHSVACFVIVMQRSHEI